MSRPGVPRLLERIQKAVLAEPDRSYILGDLAEEYREQVDSGRSPSRANLWYAGQIVQSLGPSLRRRAEVRQSRKEREHMLKGAFQDLRFGMRGLLRNPGFALLAIITLALGIGGTTAIFSVVNAVLLRPLPYPESDRLARLYDRNPDAGLEAFSVSVSHYFGWKEQSRLFQSMGAYREDGFNLLIGDGPQRVGGVRMTASLFEVMGVEAARGRWFREEEDRPGAASVVVLSHGLWQRHFGAGEEAAGQSLLIDGTPHAVVGVMPPGFSFPQREDVQVMVPSALDPDGHRGAHFLRVLGRLEEGAEVEQARREMDAVAARLQADGLGGKGWTVLLAPLFELTVEDVESSLFILFAAVGFVLLIACVNVANLLLVRGAARRGEMALRLALGAGRMRVIRQLVLESVVLAAAGCLLGAFLAWQALQGLLSLLPSGMPRAGEIALDLQALAFAIAVSLACGILFGLFPALKLSRPDLQRGLAQGGRGAGGAQHRLLGGLIVSEMALALVLMIGAGLLVQSFRNLTQVDLGYASEGILTMEISPLTAHYPDAETRTGFYRKVVEEVEALPGVESAGLTHRLPLSGSSIIPFHVEGRAVPPDGPPIVNYYAFSPGYLEALEVEVLRGRLPEERESWGAPHGIVINQALAERHFPDQEPLGQRVSKSPEGPWWRIVGVAENVRETGIAGDYAPVAYLPYPAHPVPMMVLVLKSPGDASALTSAVRSRILEVDPAQPVGRVRTLDEFLGNALALPRLNTWLIGLFAAVAVILAMVGVYGVVSFAVARKRREIAVRMALGADWGRIQRLILRRGLALAAISVAIGLAGAVGLSRFLESLLFGIEATDPVTFAVITLLLLAAALGASYIPARRAAKADPLDALRCQ